MPQITCHIYTKRQAHPKIYIFIEYLWGRITSTVGLNIMMSTKLSFFVSCSFQKQSQPNIFRKLAIAFCWLSWANGIHCLIDIVILMNRMLSHKAVRHSWKHLIAHCLFYNRKNAFEYTRKTHFPYLLFSITELFWW